MRTSLRFWKRTIFYSFNVAGEVLDSCKEVHDIRQKDIAGFNFMPVRKYDTDRMKCNFIMSYLLSQNLW